ncbi:MAG: hypothetical protein IKS32_02310 [Solobacterium sp.]|nr:hypothetical protein [Solobacterium sp.]
MSVLFAILIAASLLGLNVVLYRMNKNTPVPEGCEELKPDCTGCGITDCTLRRKEEEHEHD